MESLLILGPGGIGKSTALLELEEWLLEGHIGTIYKYHFRCCSIWPHGAGADASLQDWLLRRFKKQMRFRIRTSY